jgi:hypothetical protein
MKLEDLLSELRENILNDRSDRVEGSSDYFWSDATLVRYINEAQTRFAKRGLVIRDGTTAEVCQVTLQEGVANYTLHPKVVAVLSAKHEDDSVDLARLGHTEIDTYQIPDTHYFDLSAVSHLGPGKPLCFTTDEEVKADDNDSYGVINFRVYPTPDVDQEGKVITLRVARLPIEDLKLTGLKAHPEIPAEHHLEMLDWAAYLALRVVDIDAGAPMRANEFKESFEQHVEAARTAALRKMRAPKRWGFGRGGFNWER